MKLNIKRVLNLLREGKKSAFIKNMSVVMMGTAFAQVINFALSPVLSRVYSPEEFGLYGSFLSLVSIFSAGVTLQYSQAVMLPREDKKAFRLFVTSIISVCIVSSFLFLLIFFIPKKYIFFISDENFFVFLIIIPVFVCLTGLNLSFQSWCVRKKRFKETSYSSIIRSFTTIAVQLAVGIVGYTGIGLVIGSVIGIFFSSINLFKITLKDISLLKNISFNKIKYTAKKYIDFPIYGAPQSVLNATSQGIPVLLLAQFYDMSIVGFYAFGVKIIHVPMVFVLNALRQVLFQRVSELYNSGRRLLPLYLKSTIGLFLCGLIPATTLFFFAGDIYAFLFGQQWRESGVYSSWIVLWMLFAFCNVPSTLFSRVLRKQRFLLIYDVLLLVARITVIVISGMLFPAIFAVIAISLVGIVFNIFYILYIYKVIYIFEKRKMEEYT